MEKLSCTFPSSGGKSSAAFCFFHHCGSFHSAPRSRFTHYKAGIPKIIDELTEKLREAEREARNAKIKTAAHAALTVFELLVPEISLTARASIYLGEVILDKALGPSNTTTFQKYAGDVTPGVKQFSEAIHHIEEYHNTTHAVAETTGKVAIAATFYFDAHEIAETSESAEKIEKLLKKAKGAYDELQALLVKNRPKLHQFLKAFERWVSAISVLRKTAADVRDARAKEIAAAKYDPRRPIAWTVF